MNVYPQFSFSTSFPRFELGNGQTMSETNQLKAQKGDTISVHYIGKYVGGQVFDTSIESEAKKAGLYTPARDYKPLQVRLGAGQVIPGFEEALIGMAINEEKEVTIPPEKAYGKAGGHPMAGKTLVFKLRMTNIKR
jgi:FKBP-type peptidyl-prolyl cis-trans isomerase 2